MEITILGGGSWGTAMAQELSKRYNILIYIRDKKSAEFLNENHRNKKYLTDYELSKNIIATSDINEALKNDIVINSIPSQNIRKFLEENSDKFNKNNMILNLSKGIEISTNKRISEIFAEFLPNNKYACLSGPSHAEEVIYGVPTSLVVSSDDNELCLYIQDLLISETLRIYTNPDLLGVEYGGAVKNVLAIGCGIIDGLQLGDNVKSALITRGIHEMTRFCIKMGGDRRTLYGLTGLGDLMVTAYSKHSRNRKAGELIGQGHTIENLENEIGMVVEGMYTAKALYNLSILNKVYMPLTKIIYKILYENLEIIDAIKLIMSQEGKTEFDF